jgi:hypothetical protein
MPPKVPIAPLPFIDPNMPCAACGNRKGTLMTVPNYDDGVPVLVRHTCDTCGAKTFHRTVTQAAKDVIYPSDMSPVMNLGKMV